MGRESSKLIDVMTSQTRHLKYDKMFNDDDDVDLLNRTLANQRQ